MTEKIEKTESEIEATETTAPKKKRGRPPSKKTTETKSKANAQTKKTTAQNKKAITQNPKVEDVEVNEEIQEEKPKRVVRKTRDLNELIPVKCIVNGGLNYISSMGFLVRWDSYGDYNYLEYKELIHMMNKYKRFFKEPWVIMEQDVIEDLHAQHYYKNMIDFDDIDSIFEKSSTEIKEIIDKVPKGIKRLIADRATALKRSGELDSIKIIDVIEKTLKIELV